MKPHHGACTWDVDALPALWAEGLSTAEIGRRLGTTKNAIVGKVFRSGLPARPSPIHATGTRPPYRRSVPLPPRVTLAPLPSLDAAPARREVVKPKVAKPHHVAPPVMHAPSPALPPRWSAFGCAWPFGEPGTSAFHFCGDPSPLGRSYCATHHAVAYRPFTR